LSSAASAAALRIAVAAAFTLGAHAAAAGPIADRIKADGVIRCGGVSRPGLVGQSPDGKAAAGLYLDLCRAIGAALLGPDGRLEFRSYDADKAFDRVRNGADDLSFLAGAEILDQDLAGHVTLGPPVVFVATGVMVTDSSPIRGLRDLAGRSVCFYQASNAHTNLEARAAALGFDFVRKAFTEYGELYDAYNAGICTAQVGETGDLAVARLDQAGAKLNSRILGAKLNSRILPEPLALFPVFAATPASDPQWSATVAWALYALERAELPATPWSAGGLDSTAPRGAGLGLTDNWANRVLGAAGTYADIYARNLGEGSRLRLQRGPNAPAEAGGLFVTPFRE
jgi:general L-amino acid transport system substrate-binding protein